MTKPLEKGGLVIHEDHPEHGLGRIISIGAFAIRVLFTRGGVRVYRAEQALGLKTVTNPVAADVAQLEARELASAHGQPDAPTAPLPPTAPSKQRRSSRQRET